MNFKHDLAEISRKELNQAGIVVPRDWDDHTVCVKYLDIHHRFFDSSVSYMVAYSKELKKKLPTLTSKEQDAIKDIEERLKTRKSIVPYMSKQIRAISVSKSDFLLKNWNIYHLHLEKDTDGRSNGNLLFFQPQGRIVHFIDVRPHPKGSAWFDRELFDIIYDNWPFHLNYRPDMKPTVTVPDENVHDALKKMVLALPFRGGCIFPTRLGVATSGDSSMAVMKVNRIFNNLTAWELELNKKEKEIRREIRKLKLREPDLLEYRLEIESGHFIAYEINAHIKISLFEVP